MIELNTPITDEDINKLKELQEKDKDLKNIIVKIPV